MGAIHYWIKRKTCPLRTLWVVLSLYLQDTTNPNITILLRIMIDRDYDSYELNILDNTRIKPLLEQIRLNDLSFKFFISSVYWSPTSYDVVQKHNKEIRRTIRSFFKDDIRMWFFIEKHQEGDRFHRHILLEDASSSRWKNPDQQDAKHAYGGP